MAGLCEGGNESPGSLKSKKAFDRVNWNKLMSILKKIDVDWEERILFNNVYMKQVKVRIGEEMSEGSEIGRGIRQGCLSSSTLFNIYLEALVMNYFQNMGGVIVKGRRIKCIIFADIMALLAEEEMILKDMVLELNDISEQYGMKINANKRKSMVIGRNIQNFKYLQCSISSNMSCCQEVKRRIAMAKEAFNRKRSIFCGPLEKELSKRLVKCFVWSVALYGAETWITTK
ncbi:hypothetical protein ANN_19623 [Periplaneta americana]|uniref:Reverse transcriptase domain-containing protein n=1 Tax=Periplaneta americana TaxID=6978 RepID=A0ABQ8SB19_PERAM|nr:hypothetical protein ANN_19623 [Periplaneta americana]